MAVRHLLTPVLALAALVPCVAGNASATVRGRLLPDLPQHLQFAERDLKHGEISSALAHLSLVVMDKPIRYRIEFKDADEMLQFQCRDAFGDALDLWQNAFPGEMRFEEVGPNEKADLTISYQRDVTSKGASVAGLVNWKRKVYGDGPTSVLTADLQLRTHQPGGKPMSIEHMRHTAAHEIGHILGLDDSPFYGDIMGPLDLKRPVHGFEPTELSKLRELRASAFALIKSAVPSK